MLSQKAKKKLTRTFLIRAELLKR